MDSGLATPKGDTASAVDYILLGILGFIAGYGFGLASSKGTTRLKPVLAIAVAGLLTYSTVIVSLDSGRFWLPAWLQAVGGVLLAVSLLLLLFSMFLELPFAATYRGHTARPELVTTGTYALVRHPTVPWYVLVLGSLLLLTRSELLLVALPVWVLLDVVWVVLQERLHLTRVFPEYATYQRTTPMLIPNRRSIPAFIRSLRSVRRQIAQGG